MESEQDDESLDNRRLASQIDANTKRSTKATKATRDTITQARAGCAHIQTAVSSGGKRARGGTLNGQASIPG